MLVTAAKAALRVGVGAATRAVSHLLVHKLASILARKRKKLEKSVTGGLDPQSQKGSVDTGSIDINALIDGLVLYWTNGK